ncbi:RNA polymerase I enhancer binding protein [Linnemannia zychae]|nr:RNA polymerase I enhancer binding protein [Linnemannia zychae]
MDESSKDHRKGKKHKKNKKNKEHREHKDKKRKHEEDVELNAGSFKKALVTPITDSTETLPATSTGISSVATNSGSPTSNRPTNSVTTRYDDLNLFAGDQDSDDDSSSDDDAAASQSSAFQKATLAAVADLLTATSTTSSGGVSADVIKMQQQLQEQIPFATSTASVSTDTTEPVPTTTTSSADQLARQELLDSLGLPTMQMQLLIQQNNLASAAQQQQHAEDANAILMSLSNDPSILATVSNTEHQPTLGQIMQQEAAVQAAAQAAVAAAGMAVAADSKGSKKKKAAVPKIPKQTRTGLPAALAAAKALEDQLEYDMSSGTENLLHTKWMMATELKERGIKYRTGTFSPEEDNTIRQCIKEYIARNNMTEASIHEWFEKSSGRGAGKLERNELKPLWVEIAGRLKTRPLLNIYLHVRRMYHPQNNIGAWTKTDDAKLVELYAQHKGQWTVIGQALGRMADSCRDRYRNHLKDLATMNTGSWSPEEDRRLLDIMQEFALKQGKTNLADAQHMWTAISERMGGTRSRHQCRHRYTQSLQPKMELADWKPPTLAETLAASNVIQLRKSITAKSQQPTELAEEGSSSPSVLHPSSSSVSNEIPDENTRALAAALQNVLPSGSDGSILWTQAFGGAEASGSTQTVGASPLSSADQADHAALTAAIAAATSLPVPNGAALLTPALLATPTTTSANNTTEDSTATTVASTGDADANPNPLPPTPDHLQRRTGARQRSLDVVRLIQKSGYNEYSEIKWKTIAKKLRTKIQEANGEMLGKVIEARERLSAKRDKAINEGDRYNGSALTGVVVAMDAALTAAHAESVTTVQFSASSAVLQHGFGLTRAKIEGYKLIPFKELLELMVKAEEAEVSYYKAPSKVLTSPEYAEAAIVPGPAANRESFASLARFRQLRIYTVAKQAARKALSHHFGDSTRRALSSIQARAEDRLEEEFSSPEMMPILYVPLLKLQPAGATSRELMSAGYGSRSGGSLSESGSGESGIRTNEFVEPGEEDSDYEEDLAAAAAAAAKKNGGSQQEDNDDDDDDE